MPRFKTNSVKCYKILLIIIFSFLLGCMFTINLVPIDKTCRIENTNREYNIMHNSKLNNPELIILIISAFKNLANRNTIRQTWLKLQDSYTAKEDINPKFRMKHYFVIGSLGLKADELSQLSSEQSDFEDILIIPMYDSYQNITEKVVRSLEWLDEQYDFGLGFKYVLKCDDDSFVRVDNVLHELRHIELIYLKSDLEQALASVRQSSSPYLRANVQMNGEHGRHNDLQLYWGYFNGAATVQKQGKWREENWIACDKYLPYALGGGYVISKKLVSYVAQNAENLRFFNNEDVSMGVWLTGVNNVLRIHDTRFDTAWTSRGCQNPYLVRHKISLDDMHAMYENIVKTNNLCNVEVITRTFYNYNWSLPPSKCCTVKDLVFT